MIDENEFFRNATLGVCGDLEIEVALSSCVRVMDGIIPIDRIYLQVYEPDLGAMRTLAEATAEEGKSSIS